MTKIVTMRIDENLLKQFNNFAKLENRSLSNFIETATKKYINEIELTDDFETNEILDNKSLLKKLANGRKDAKSKQKRFSLSKFNNLQRSNKAPEQNQKSTQLT